MRKISAQSTLQYRGGQLDYQDYWGWDTIITGGGVYYCRWEFIGYIHCPSCAWEPFIPSYEYVCYGPY